MENLNLFIGVFFVLVTGLTIYLFYSAVPTRRAARNFVQIALSWITIQSLLSLTGFYLKTDGTPPRIVLLLFPPLLFTIAMFMTVSGRNFIDSLDARRLTILHTIRVPVEIILYLLFIDKQVPRLMSFAGGNLDILSGLSAPVIYYLVYVSGKAGERVLLIWNIVCLGLLVRIVSHAVLSIPSPFQRMGFDQPNSAILHFPYSLLPCCVVPLVLFSQLTMIRRLTIGKTKPAIINS